MPLETGTYINDLVATNPAHADGLNQADSHMRLIKAVLQNTLPGLTGPLTSSAGGLLARTDNVAFAFASEPTLGFFRSSAGTMGYTGTLLGAIPIGGLIDFAGATAPTGYLACDGQAVSRTTYAALFTAIGTTWGAGDGSTTFNVPSLMSRFRRHRDTGGGYGGAVGNLQNPQNLSHTHTGSGTTAANTVDHTHTFSGTTGSMNQNASHTHSSNAAANGGGSSTGGGGFSINVPGAATINATNTDHQHAFSGTTSGVSAFHTHTYSFTTSGGSADAAEARPYSATVLTCIRVS